jgi:hypothetical protein
LSRNPGIALNMTSSERNIDSSSSSWRCATSTFGSKVK